MEKCYDLSQISNTDQTPVSFYMSLNTIDRKESYSLITCMSGSEKQSCIVICAAMTYSK